MSLLIRKLTSIFNRISAARVKRIRGSTTRLLSSGTDQEWISVKEDINDGFAVLAMKRAPVNSLNLEFLTQLNIAFEKLENERSCRGVVLTSSLPKIFSAGLDITEMYRCEAERAAKFWRSLQDLWLTLYSSRLITLAAINGHAPAGGCLLATCCDHRAMIGARGYTIGLNETLLGIVAPFWFKDSMQNVAGHRVTERCIQLGTLFTAEEAAGIRLVDEVCTSQEALDSHTREEMARWMKIPDAARILSKQMMRRDTIYRMESGREDDIKNFVSFVMKDSVQAQLGAYLEKLQKKKKPS